MELLSQAIKHEDTIYDLMEIEHAYAPPFSSAKDPVNIAGFVAENILSNKMKVVYWNEILQHEKEVLIDVRTEQEFNAGHIPGAISIPVDELRHRLVEIPNAEKIVLYCAVGQRGYLAYRILSQSGFSNIYNLSGGYSTWVASHNETHLVQKNIKDLKAKLAESMSF